YGATIASVKTLLVNQHKFNLSAKDLADMDRVFSVFLESGPGMDYSSGGSFTGGWSMPTYAELMTADDRAAIPVNRSYLASEENYRAIRDLQRNNLIVPLVGDFAGPKAIRAVAEYLRGHNATVTAFYLSNVEQYLFNDGVERKFYENVATLPLDSSSRFIRTFGPASGGGGFGGFSFDTETAAIQKDIAAFKEGRVSSYYDLRNLSH
ncbi:MAG TPA: hypothetical protein VFY29_11010, partial [Terriglobia bacterium]|nr:hypothetical protein [Terriglobia bacterium]